MTTSGSNRCQHQFILALSNPIGIAKNSHFFFFFFFFFSQAGVCFAFYHEEKKKHNSFYLLIGKAPRLCLVNYIVEMYVKIFLNFLHG